MREYLMQDWTLVVGLLVVMAASIICQLVMMYSMSKLIKEGEKLPEVKKEKTDFKSKQSGRVIPCKKVAIPAFYML